MSEPRLEIDTQFELDEQGRIIVHLDPEVRDRLITEFGVSVGKVQDCGPIIINWRPCKLPEMT